MGKKTPPPPIDSVITVTVANPVAGGQCIARADGRVVFVRGGLPGEVVQARVTGSGRGGGFVRADVTKVLSASPSRVEPPCPVAGECGGCDWQHAELSYQRTLKAQVIVDALKRTGGVEEVAGVPVAAAIVVQAPDDGDGLSWRSRMRFATDPYGTLGLRAHNSHNIIPAAHCPIASPQIREAVQAVESWPPDQEIVAVSTTSGDLAIGGLIEPSLICESVHDREWEVPPTVFWQVHPKAPELLVEAVLAAAQIVPGERVADLYSGAGLFAAFLGEAVGITGHVDAVEGSSDAVAAAIENLADLPQVIHHEASVETWLRTNADRHPDVVVLDPPRSGAGADVVDNIAALCPRTIVYVACDPVALARDTKTLAGLGYQLTNIRAFDIFPMTKHVECVATFKRA